MNPITENEIEQIAIRYLQELGYSYVLGPDIAPDGINPERQYSEVVLATRLRNAIEKLNPSIPDEAREDALKKVLRNDSPNALINNENFHRFLTEGVDVEVRTNDGIRGNKVYIADFNIPENNEFLVVNQFTIIENNQNKRPDLIVFVNGLPIIVVELKNATDELATVKTAYNQLQTYKQAIPSLFTYNELLIVSDGWDAKFGTITSDWSRFSSWKTKDLPAQRPNMFYVYAVLCYNDSIYIGQTDNLERRWKEHLLGVGAEWTKKFKPKMIVHFEEYKTREEAVKREHDLKTGFGRKWLKREIAAGRARQAGGKTTADTLQPQMEVMFNGMLNKKTILDLIRHFIVFEKSKEKTLKKIAAYHQYYAVNKAVKSTMMACGFSYPYHSSHHYRGGLDFSGLVSEARELRKTQTSAEAVFWELVRDRKFLNLKFRRQHQINNYIVDFYCNELNLIVELDGNVHDTIERKKFDITRDKFLTSSGYNIIRFRNSEILNNVERVLERITSFISSVERSGKGTVSHTEPETSSSLSLWERTGEGDSGQNSPDFGNRKAGVIWHTQGSGKSLSMVFYTGKLVLALDNPTIVVLTDRNDLDDQLYDTFTNCQQLLRQEPQQASDRKHLRKLLSVASGGIVFTTIQKFMPLDEDLQKNGHTVNEPSAKYIGAEIQALSLRKNIIVIADEAHRSQYDFIDGYAKYLRDALPHASFIGFTGTPIESNDRNTQAVFGNYVDIYDIQQAVEDNSTVPIFYESRLAKVHFDEDEKATIDEQFEEVTEGEELTQRQQLRAKWTRLEAIVGNPNRIKKIAEDLIYHFEQRNSVLDGKAMIVCMSRRICVEMYDAIIKLRPSWHSDEDDKGFIKVIMTGSSSDELHMQPHIRNKERRKAIGERLKNPGDSLKLVIVRDMWLTGFDAPCLHTLYVDKPMRGHSLMQAIARVNRVFTDDKRGGLVVDYLGIAQELKQALAEYTASGGEGRPTLDQEVAVAKMLEYYEAIEYQLRHFDWKKFFTLTPEEKLRYIPLIVDYIFSQDNGEQSFVENTKNLLKAFAISVPHEKAIAIRDNVALFQAIKARLVKIADQNEGGKTDEEIETAIKQIISEAITADKVIDVFDAAGIKKPNIEILDERFLQELLNMPHRNLAVELLKKLLKDEIRQRTKINLVESRKFSEMLEDAIKRYHNGMIDTVEFLEKVLIPLAKEIKDSDRRGEKLGLDFREYAFFTALEVNNSAVAILGDETLRHIAKELLESVRNNTTIDWTLKESVQATLRRNIRRILRKHGYPPDLQEKAVETVIIQAKMLAEELIQGRNENE